ncbi:MAG: transporter [Verrucomicrobia bacterium]|nr:transporter [Verrucomicrobiota bacterium]
MVVLLSSASLAVGADCSCFRLSQPPDKSTYNLFNPTPDNLLRDLDTDRPDKSTSPHTLDAGHFQIESDFLRYTRTQGGGSRTESWAWGSTDFRVGLTNRTEIQFYIPFYQSVRDTNTQTQRTQHTQGIGDLSVILKTNFWGNDSGDTAGGAAFFVKTPTASQGLGNGKVEGGALFLLEAKLPLDFDLTFNTGAALSANDDGGYHADILNVINLSHDIAGPFSAYAEFFSAVPTKHSGDWIGTVDVGVTMKIGKNLQFDAGMNIGVTRGADDLEPFVGVTYRF